MTSEEDLPKQNPPGKTVQAETTAKGKAELSLWQEDRQKASAAAAERSRGKS